MARNNAPKIELTAYDDLFQTDESRAEAALSKIRDIPISEIDEFPDHPFKVLMDEDMEQLVDSIKRNGVMTPATVRQKEDGRYELMQMFREVADIQTSDMLKLPVPKVNYHNIKTKPSQIQTEMVAELAKRAEKVRARLVEPQVDNMLKITNDGRKLALDQRMIDPMLPDDPDSKVNACVENVYRIWEEHADTKAAQLVFCDLSTPKNDGSFNIYDDIRGKLTERGVPAEQIRFIHEATTDAQKKELFAKVRSGEVRVLLGSTPKMGAGTNVQDRLIAIHNLDCPWRPSDLEQRQGRIERQGNLFPEVEVYRYVTEQTFDAYLYQLVESKQKFISQIMTSKSPVRSAEDVDEVALSFAEVKMLATGDERFKEKMDLDIQVSKLRVLKQSYLSEHYDLEDRILQKFPKLIKEYEERIIGYEADTLLAEQHKPQGDDKFSPMTLQGVTYTEKADAGHMSDVQVIKANKSENRIRGRKVEILRVAAYCRVSTDSEDQLNSYKSQVMYYTDLIKKKHEWSLVDIYADEAITGTQVTKREDFQRMINDCMNGDIDMVITKSISRFARNTLDTLKYVRMLKEKGIAVFFEDENINTLTMDGELLLVVLSSVAQQEVENISSNVKKGLKMKMKRGELVGFQGCLGYDYHKETKSISVNEKEAEIVRYIFNRYIEGAGCTVIANELENLGYKTKYGSSKWVQSTVIGIIKNEKYKGDLLLGKTFTVDPISKRRLENFGEEDKFYIRDHHEPIVSEEIFEEAQKILAKRNVNRGVHQEGQKRNKFSRKYAFSCMIKCGFCGGTLTRRNWHSSSAYTKTIWQCVTATKRGKNIAHIAKAFPKK